MKQKGCEGVKHRVRDRRPRARDTQVTTSQLTEMNTRMAIFSRYMVHMCSLVPKYVVTTQP